MAKYLLIAAIVISLATAGIGFVNHGTLMDTRATLADTQTTLKGTQGRLTLTEGELATTKTSLETTIADKEKIAGELSTTKSELDTTKVQLDTTTQAAAEKDARIAKLEEDIANATQGADGGTGTLEELQGKFTELNQRIQEQDAALAAAADTNKGLVAQVGEFKKKDEERNLGLMKKGLEGRVLAVNPAWNFVVLSIGDKQGVVNNAEMLIKRGGQYLGKVRITSVEPSTSIADIVANSLPTGVSVQPGDSVIFQAIEN